MLEVGFSPTQESEERFFTTCGFDGSIGGFSDAPWVLTIPVHLQHWKKKTASGILNQEGGVSRSASGLDPCGRGRLTGYENTIRIVSGKPIPSGRFNGV